MLTGNHPDPAVTRVVNANGDAEYLLVHTSGSGDIPIYRSTDLINWTLVNPGAFGVIGNNPLMVNGLGYCSIWAPHIHALGQQSYMLSFSASRFQPGLSSCPAFNLDGGSYAAWSNSSIGSYAPQNHPWEPLRFAPAPSCPTSISNLLPQSPSVAQAGCRLPGDCSATIRIDPEVFKDPLTGRSWLAYTWFTNSPPSAADSAWHGEHVSIVELDGADPFTIRCDQNVTRVHAAYPQDTALLQRLSQSCPRCSENLSMTRDRFGNEMYRDGRSWGVVEGPSLFRRGNYVYLLMSGSGWDSPYYNVFWVAAPTVEELRYDNPNRIVGRYLIPSNNEAFGHGTVVAGPDCRSWYYVHHRLSATNCQQNGNCARNVWVSPIEFEDRNDGLGEVHIKPRFPAENRSVTVRVPR